MNLQLSTNRNFKRVFLHILSIFVIAAVAFPVTGSAYAQELNPRLTVSVTHDWFRAEEFSPGGILNVKIYDQQDGTLLWEENRTADESGFLVVEGWEHPVDLKPGNYLVIADDFTTKDLVLEAVTLDVFDPSNDYLAGTAPPAPGGRPVWIWTGNDSTACSMDVIADPVSGAWEADFSTQPCDVMEDMWAVAQVFDEDGDASEGNLPRVPIFTVFPEWEAIEGWGWTQDATVHLEIDDPNTGQSPDHSQDAQVVPLPWNPNDIWVRFDFAGLYDVKPGDVVSLSEGATSRTHIVQNLAITGVNEVEDAVSGTAEEGETIYVWPHATGQQVEATAGSGGAWQVDFTGIFDLVPGECIRSEVRDDTGNATGADGCIPNPHFSAFPEWDSVEGWEWPLDAMIHMTIDDPATGANPDYEKDQPVVVTPWDLNGRWVQFNFNGQYDLKVGDVVTLTDGVTPRTHTVRNLSITGVDEDTNIVSGTADEGETIYVWPHATGQQVQVTAGTGGIWQADFTGIFDLVPGEAGRSEVRDEFGNATAVDWHILNPHLEAFAWFDRYSLVDWPMGLPIEITIQNPAYHTTFTPDGSSNWYDLFPGVDLRPGTVITATNGETTKVLEISPLRAEADPNTGIVTGVATPDRSFHMRIENDHFQTPIEQDIEAGPDGNWSVAIESDLPWAWLTRGLMWEWDDDGDVTQAIWHVHNELVEVWLAQNEIRAFDWPLDTELTFNVDGVDIATAFTQPVDWIEGTAATVHPGDLRLEPGMTVTVTDGTTSASTIIQDIKITHADPENDLVYGYAPSHASIELGSFEDDPHFRFFNAEADGSWIVDYSTPSLNGVTVDVNLGDNFTLFMREDDKDATVWEWNVTNPHFVVFPEWEWFDGLDWPNEATVTITVEGKPECETTKESWDNFFNGSFGEGCDLVTGDTVTFTDGFTMRTHTVRNLSVSDANADTETVSGAADPGSVVQVWPHGHDQDAFLQITPDDDGTWSADFGSVGFNLVPGIFGRSQVQDGAGNATAVDWLVPLPGWEQINVSGFGNPLTTGISALEAFRGQLYAGASNWETGGEIWRLGRDDQWVRVNEPGFGSGPASPAIIDLHVFQGQLYAGTGWNNETPGQLWRSSDGMNWQPVTTSGFNDPDNIAITNLVVFKGMLYAGTGTINSGAQVWRSSSGNPNSWEQVAPDGSALAGNVTGFGIYKKALYAAVEPAGALGGPIQVWRSLNGSDWTVVTEDGFGDLSNTSTGGFAQFGGYLYLGTRNEVSGAQLWRSRDGIHWEQTMGDGFGDLNNVKIESLFLYDDLLYATTFNPYLGLQVWRSADGLVWEQVVANGFGDGNNDATLWNSATLLYQGRILIGTWNDVEGGELWRFTP